MPRPKSIVSSTSGSSVRRSRSRVVSASHGRRSSSRPSSALHRGGTPLSRPQSGFSPTLEPDVTDAVSLQTRAPALRVFASSFGLRWLRMLKLAIPEARVRPIRVQAENVRLHESVEHHLAHRLLNATQSLHLFRLQPQARHFEKIGPDPFQQLWNRRGGHKLALRSSRSAFSQSSTS